MTDQIDFHKLDMGNYVRLLHHLLGDGSEFGIVGRDYKSYWQSWEEDSGPIDRMLAAAKSGDPKAGDLPETLHGFCPGDHTLLVRLLDLDYLETEFYFIAILQQKYPGTPVSEEILTLFSYMVDFLTVGINLSMENENMARELSQRYEELNLIYQADERSKDVSNISKSLVNILEDITEFIDVRAAFLWIPDMKHWIFHAPGDISFVKKEASLKMGVLQLFDQLGKNPQSLVITEPAADQLPMVLSPVFSSDHKLLGAIGCIRKINDPEFGTGERKLVDVIAQHVGKIISNKLDVLTGLINRVGFDMRLKELLAAPSLKGPKTAVAFINIDQFKLLNDAYGLDGGDAVLKQMARILGAHLRDGDFLARTDGDEFVVILSGIRTDHQCRVILERIKKAVSKYNYQFEKNSLSITVRMGLVYITQTTKAVTEVVSKGEIALESAIKKGGNCICFFEEGDARYKEKQDQALYATRLEALVEKRQFLLFCQPIIPLRGGQMHYEILIRLKDDDNKIIPPFKFLPAAERYNKMTLIDKWVIETTCGALQESAAILRQHDITWAINLSGQSLQDESFISFFLSFLSELTLPPAWLGFEVTETVAIQNFSKVIHVIKKIQQLGFSVSLDDFGTGYSSFEYLKKLPVSFLKIDGTFVKNLHKDPFDQVMVQSIVTIAKHLKMKTIAEFVENEEILQLLKDFGVDYSQGYHTGKPRDFSDTLKELQDNPRAGQRMV